MNSKLLFLDGATGTELNRRGVDTGLPWWSANALTTDAELITLRDVHLEYLNAGADIITTNTFRTDRRALVGKGFSAREMSLRAVAIAREAVAEFGKPACQAGALSTLEHCYCPDLEPTDKNYIDEHAELYDEGHHTDHSSPHKSTRSMVNGKEKIELGNITSEDCPYWVRSNPGFANS